MRGLGTGKTNNGVKEWLKSALLSQRTGQPSELPSSVPEGIQCTTIFQREKRDFGTFSSVFAHLPRSNFCENNCARTAPVPPGTSCGFKFSPAAVRPCAAVCFSVRRARVNFQLQPIDIARESAGAAAAEFES